MRDSPSSWRMLAAFLGGIAFFAVTLAGSTWLWHHGFQYYMAMDLSYLISHPGVDDPVSGRASYDAGVFMFVCGVLLGSLWSGNVIYSGRLNAGWDDSGWNAFWSFVGFFLTTAVFIMAGNVLAESAAPKYLQVVVGVLRFGVCVGSAIFWVVIYYDRSELLRAMRDRYAFRTQAEKLAKELSEVKDELFALKHPDCDFSEDGDWGDNDNFDGDDEFEDEEDSLDVDDPIKLPTNLN